jgi:enamine deaminase RidA (YjgF/YER057c/UK114 family)
MGLHEQLKKLSIAVPQPAGPFGSYIPAKKVGNLIFVSGQLPMLDGKLIATGPVPSRCSVDQARAAARQCIINGLAAAATVVDLDQLVSVVRLGVFVNSDAKFFEQPKVANAASELLIQLFGENGKHARAAVGVNSLPLDAAVEIEMVLEGEPSQQLNK